jgi:hypothetical protein
MILRDLEDGSVLLITQEDHAELSAQFAAHWGNSNFAKLCPYESMVFATLYHDSGYREWEGLPPINLTEGRPYGHREDPPGFEPIELQSYVRNIEWVRSYDRYAGLLVSMHRTGLWQSRYETMGLKKSGRERSPAVRELIKRLETAQEQEKEDLSRNHEGFESELWFNYRLLQVYDILSLYFCCNGYDNGRLKQEVVGPIAARYDAANEEVRLRITPVDSRRVRVDPYPFDCSPLDVAIRARSVSRGDFGSEKECRESYFKAPRIVLDFQLTI